MAKMENIRKVGPAIASQLLKFKGKKAVAVEVALPGGKKGSMPMPADKEIEIDMLAATFYKKGATLSFSADNVTWKFQGATFTPQY